MRLGNRSRTTLCQVVQKRVVELLIREQTGLSPFQKITLKEMNTITIKMVPERIIQVKSSIRIKNQLVKTMKLLDTSIEMLRPMPRSRSSQKDSLQQNKIKTEKVPKRLFGSRTTRTKSVHTLLRQAFSFC